jgi:5-formaminoimidazole-4-carboxamide-1-beta-D-ribofuranosyl 5'-monophosphate synthetase
LIPFLLVVFKAISQNITQSKDSVVILSERQARAVVTDLVKYDFLKITSKEQDKRIANFEKIVVKLENTITIKDAIIKEQKNYMSVLNEYRNIKPKPQFHGYTGIQSSNFTFNIPMFTGRLLLEYKKVNFGVQYIGIPNINNRYGVLVEYKLF